MNTHGKLLSAMSAAALALVSVGAAQAQSFTNFGFETPSTTGLVQGGNAANQLGAGAYDLGWNFKNGFVGGTSNPYGSGTPPQGTQVAILQNGSNFAQSLGFAQAGTYQISFSAAQRANNTQLLSVSMDGATILPSFAPAGGATVNYNPYQTATFTVTAGQHNFVFNGLGNTTNGGDNTAFVDNVQLNAQQAAPQTIAITNPSFETYNNGVGLGTIAGWTAATGGLSGTNRGINTTQTPFTDGKVNPDGGEVAFIQRQNGLSQNLSGFTLGQNYVLTFFANARFGNTANLNVTLGGKQLVTNAVFASTSATTPYTFESVPFTYDGTFNGGMTSAALSFAQTAAGDTTLLLDGVQITAAPAAAPEPSQFAALAIGMLGLGALALKARKRTIA